MKEATGELNMTVVTLIAVAAVGALFYLVIWPMIQRMVVQQTCNTYGTDWTAVKQADVLASSTQATVSKWYCCPKGKTSTDEGCIAAE